MTGAYLANSLFKGTQGFLDSPEDGLCFNEAATKNHVSFDHHLAYDLFSPRLLSVPSQSSLYALPRGDDSLFQYADRQRL
jgi:hypothetical protein